MLGILKSVVDLWPDEKDQKRIRWENLEIYPLEDFCAKKRKYEK